MASHQDTHDSTQNQPAMTRRAALQGAAAAGALALPVGAAVAAELPGDVDPGLAAIEDGYRRLTAMWANFMSLSDDEDEAFARASDLHDELYPAPAKPAELSVFNKMTVGSIDALLNPPTPEPPLSPELLEKYRAWKAGWHAWLDSRPPMSGPDADQWRKLTRKRERMLAKHQRDRRRLLKTPTNSPQGLMLKIAIAFGAENVEGGLREALRCNEPVPELWPALLADLRAMSGEAVA
jgi:hypothetical protein